MKTLTLLRGFRGWGFQYRLYQSRRGYLKAAGDTFAPREATQCKAFCRFDEYDSGIGIATVVALNTKDPFDLLMTVTHECGHAAEFLESWLRRRRAIVGIDPSEFQAYMASGLISYIFSTTPKEHAAALLEIDKAFMTDKELFP